MNFKNFLACVLAGIFFVLCSMPVRAQIGYQVSLLNSATGEPRANVTVSSQVKITDSKGKVVCSEMKQVTSNDFGVLSLMVGKEDTFKDVDTGALPLFIEVSVDGKLIGKTQILSVPVAEIATRLKSSFTKENLVGTWKSEDAVFTFRQDNTGMIVGLHSDVDNFEYEIEGNLIYLYCIYQCYEDFGDGIRLYTERDVLTFKWRNGELWEIERDPFILSKQ